VRLDAIADQALQQPPHAIDGLVHIERLGLQHLLPGIASSWRVSSAPARWPAHVGLLRERAVRRQLALMSSA
jgi:hypothetical protein